MTNQNQIEQFLRLLEESGLPQERKNYWMERLAKGAFDADDIDILMSEMDQHFANVDYAVAVTEAELAENQAKLQQTEAAMMPALQQVADALPEALKQETKEYKKEISEAENELMAEMKTIRSESNQEDIDALRKKLLSGGK